MEAGDKGMSTKLGRRTLIGVSIKGTDVTDDANRYLLSLKYTDNEVDKADDLQLNLDDREGVWLNNWLDSDEGTKGAELSAAIIQKNWDSSGRDMELDCGIFQIDDLSGNGPPATVKIKGTSLPHQAAIRTARQTRAWENITLRGVSEEIARRNGMKYMYESTFNPFYDRREQVNLSDISFLQGLCNNAGISLKASGGIIILFDAATYEQRPTVLTITKGKSNIHTYGFKTTLNDSNYARSKVVYTDPRTGHTLEYIFTPPGSDPDGQTYYINERTTNLDEARNLAMRRLRQKNKGATKMNFTLDGDVRLLAGVTVNTRGFGMFSCKYIIESATHNVGEGGYTTSIKLRRVLEGY